MPPVLVVNPASDKEFAQLVERLFRDGADTPRDLEHRLRRTYPKAVVSPSVLHGEPFETWYVYREGTWILPPET